MKNAEQLSAAMMMYQNDYDGIYPLASNWNEVLPKYAKYNNIMVCPAAKDKTEPSYAMNDKLSGIEGGKITSIADTVGIYESESGKNQSDGPGLFPSPARHNDGYTVGFADGHVKMVAPTSTSELVWDPAATTPPAAGTDNTEVAPPSG